MYYFIVNPNARRGAGEKIWRKLESQLMSAGVDYEVRLTEKLGDAKAFAEELTERFQEPRVIVGVGGDGTVNEILNGMSFEGQVTLGYIPAGSGNDLARSLRLPKNPRRCLKKILNPRYHKCLDYGILSYGEGEPEYRRFMVSCGMGMNAAVSQDLLEVRKHKKPRFFKPGRLSYVILGLKHLILARPVKGYLILDGVKKVEFNHIYFIASHIHPFEGGGFRFAPKADCSDGYLEICVVHNKAKRRLVPILLDALIGRMGHHRGVRFYGCREVQIHTERPMPVHVDGESCFCQTDIHLRCVEKKIRMMV